MALGAAVAGLVGTAIGARGAESAADTQAASADAAIAETRRSTEQARTDLAPFTQAGSGVLNQLSDFVSTGPETDFERTEGFDAIQKSAAAGNKLRSGETLKDLTSFNAGVNQRFRSQRFNELFSLANLGRASAAGSANVGVRGGENVSSLLVGQGDAKAAGTVGKVNALGTGIDEFGSFLGTLKKKPVPVPIGRGP